MSNIFIPKKLKVGYQERSDTFTKRLAYVIYYDERGKLRKERSWEGWRHNKITPDDFDNEPRSGFVFNKGVQRDRYWGSGRNMIRVWDPRNFEFEISVDNLMGLLMHSDVSKREIQQECVFAWQGTELLLLPTNSVEYTEAQAHTAKQDMKVSAKELVPGRTYSAKKYDAQLTYLGYREWYVWEWELPTNPEDRRYSRYHTAKNSPYGQFVRKADRKHHIFYTVADDGRVTFEPKTPSVLSHALSEETDPHFAERVQQFNATHNAAPGQELYTTEVDGKLADVSVDYSGKNESVRFNHVNFIDAATGNAYVANVVVGFAYDHAGYHDGEYQYTKKCTARVTVTEMYERVPGKGDAFMLKKYGVQEPPTYSHYDRCRNLIRPAYVPGEVQSKVQGVITALQDIAQAYWASKPNTMSQSERYSTTTAQERQERAAVLESELVPQLVVALNNQGASTAMIRTETTSFPLAAIDRFY